MNTKKQLPKEILNQLIEALENNNVEQDIETVFEGKTSFITVDDYEGEAVSASYDFYEDGPRSSATTPTIHYTIIANVLKFVATQKNYDIGHWQLVSDEYFISEDEMSEVEDLLYKVVNRVDPYDFGCDFPSSLSEEWTEEEVTEEILSQLSSDKYIEFEDEIYPLPGSIEDFIDDYNTEHDTNLVLDEIEYALLTPQEVAARLTEEIYE